MEAIFPVIFFDGECETNIGHVVVYPSLDYKTLQSFLSHKIGISPSQFSVYLADAKTSRKIPITGKANFSAICRETDCFFLVSLRRSRDPRSRRLRRQQPEKQPVANVMLLKRNSDVGAINNNENNNNNNDWHGLNGGVLVCEECVRAKETGRDFGFHGCVYDTVTYGFKSPAGPIARPVKESV